MLLRPLGVGLVQRPAEDLGGLRAGDGVFAVEHEEGDAARANLSGFGQVRANVGGVGVAIEGGADFAGVQADFGPELDEGRFVGDVTAFGEVGFEERFLGGVAKTVGGRQVGKTVGVEGRRDDRLVEVIVETRVGRHFGDAVVHGAGLVEADALVLGQVLVDVLTRILLKIRVQLEALPGNGYILFVGEGAQGFLKMPFADITERTHDIGPDLDFHARKITTFAGMDYFKALQALLAKERQEDKDAYMGLMRSSSVVDRRAAGLAWYPVAIRGSEPGRGDYLILEVERTTHRDIPHQLRFGASALFFSNHDPERDHVEGVISYQGGDRLKITLKEEELPDWAQDGKLGIDLLFDDNSYDEMLQALKRADAGSERRLVRVLTGGEQPKFDGAETTVADGALNVSQRTAVQRILGAQDLAIVHGPPGTGKTTTLVQAIKALIARDGEKVLVTAPSNTAVDLLSERLSEEGVNVLRVGNPARVSERLSALTLDAKMAAHPSVKEIRQLRRRAVEFRDMAHKYKRQFGKAEREQRRALFEEARKIMKDVENVERYILEDLLSKTQVVAATLVGAAHYTIRDVKFGTAVIDEAGQALEPACWIPALRADRLVLAGDHLQLPPVIKSAEAARGGLEKTLLEKCVALHPEAVTLLEEQYRMHELIMGYPSKVFYEQRLRAHPLVAGRLLPGQSPLAFIDTAGCGFEERQEGNALGNPEEAGFVVKHLARLVSELPSDVHPSIGVISPYRLQVQLLREQVEHTPTLAGESITVNTIDGFQGQERDVIYISMTRSNPDSRIGFLSEIRRMNVAMTRARMRLVVIGDSATLSQSPFYAEFIEYAQRQGEYRSAWEYME